MDPVSLAISGIGMGISLWGASKEKERAKEQAALLNAENAKKTALQIQQNETQAARATRDAIRRAQVSRGMSTNFAGNSGALGSSGFFGASAQISNQEALATSAIGQDLASANTLIGINQRISSINSESAMQSADNQFITGLGGVISGNANSLSRLGQTATGFAL